MQNRGELLNFFSSLGFVLETQRISESFGDYFLIMHSSHLRLRVSSEKLFESVEISSLSDRNNWFDLGLVKSFLFQESKLSQPFLIENALVFFENYYSEIASLFDDEGYSVTRSKLDALRNERAKQMFPNSSLE